MTRDDEDDIKRWYYSVKRKPLLLRGARQVGKSTLVRRFAEKEGLVLNEINLERNMRLSKVFASLDIARILEELSVIAGRNVGEDGSLLFLDEIQAVPEAIAALRYFYEDRPDLAVVSAGSLLEFALTSRNLSMPVGRVQYHYLGPMSFDEFLEEVDSGLLQYCQDAVERMSIPETAHELLCRRLRQYMFTGGMPEAVKAFSSEGITSVQPVHRTLIETYEDDFAKYAHGADLGLMQSVFRNLPPQSCAKVKYVNYSREVPSRNVKSILSMFLKARLCADVRACACDGVPLFTGTEESTWKQLFLDVGLMNYACGVDWRSLAEIDDVRFVNEGQMAEQFIGQHLLYRNGGLSRPELAYWLREGRMNNAEVDFVVSSGHEIMPIEVKAGKSGSLKSLREFVIAKNINTAYRFDCNPPGEQSVIVERNGVRTSYKLVSLPMYAIGTFCRKYFRQTSGE